MLTFNQYLSEDHIEFSAYDLKKKYAEFNHKLFQGKLPDIPLEWASLKNVGGVTKASVIPDPNNPGPVRRNPFNKYEGFIIKPGTLKIQLSSMFKREEEGLDLVLIHEMIHVWFMAVEHEYTEQHGPKFMAMCRKLSAEFGKRIPLTDDTKGLELAIEKDAKTMGVLMFEHGSEVSFALMSDSLLKSSQAEIKSEYYWKVRGHHDRYFRLYVVASPSFNRAAVDYPMQRKVTKMAFYKMKPELLADLKANGKLIGTIRTDPADL